MEYGYGTVDMLRVMNNIEEYIIPENREACKMLWDKNIFTKMCNNYDNDESWITLGKLSEENQKIFDEHAKKDKRFNYTFGGIGLIVDIKPGIGVDTCEEFRELIDVFEYQDVQSDGCMSLEEFMIYYTDCYQIIDRNRVFDESKMTRTYEEYIEDSEFNNLCVDGKVYYNQLYFDAHMKYKRFLSNENK